MQTAVITGSNRGIGYGLAHELRRRGWNVVVTGRGTESVDDAVRRLGEVEGAGGVTGVPCDVSDAAAVQALWDTAVTEYERVDLWVNNAGVARTVHPVADLRPEWITEMVTSNMLGTMFGCQVAARGMGAQGGGTIVNILGGGSDGKIRAGMTVYGATKRGLRAFTDAFAKELDGGPVVLASVSPGVVVTDGMVREAHELGPDGFAANRRVLNILADHVEDVAPEIVDLMLSAKHGASLKRMGALRLGRRFATGGRGRDVFARYDL